MNISPLIFLFLLIISAFGSLVNGYFLYKRRRAPGAIYFSYLMVSIFIWTLGYIIELYFSSLDEKLFGLGLQYILGIPFVPVLWLIAAIQFTTLEKRPSRNERILLFIVPVLTVLLLMTSGVHNIYYSNFRIEKSDSFKILAKDFGVWFYVNLIYDYLALFAGSFLLIISFKKSRQIFRSQIIVLFIAVLLPWIANAIYVLGMNSFMKLDITPIAFNLSVALMGWSIYRYHLFDVIPAARDVIFESMDHGLIVIDLMDRVVDLNPTAIRIFGMRALYGEPFNNVLVEMNVDPNELRIEQTHSIEAVFEGQVYELVISPVYDNKNLLAGKVLTFHDITQLKKNESDLKELNATKDKFFSIIAHDLRNPFFGIMGLSDILSDEEEEIPAQERIRITKEIKDLTKNTYHMLESLLDWSRSQTGKMECNPTEFDIGFTVMENLSQLKNSAELKKIELSSNVPLDLFVFADENMINTVIRNVISNAIKFTPQSGSIIISHVSSDGETVISVKDTGVGMDEKTIEQIFQLDRTTTSVGTAGEKGTGLGMTLCNEFIKRNKGKIWVTSKIGEGSTVSFSLPSNNSKHQLL